MDKEPLPKRKQPNHLKATPELDYSATCAWRGRTRSGKLIECDEYRQKGYRYCPLHVRKA